MKERGANNLLLSSCLVVNFFPSNMIDTDLVITPNQMILSKTIVSIRTQIKNQMINDNKKSFNLIKCSVGGNALLLYSNDLIKCKNLLIKSFNSLFYFNQRNNLDGQYAPYSNVMFTRLNQMIPSFNLIKSNNLDRQYNPYSNAKIGIVFTTLNQMIPSFNLIKIVLGGNNLLFHSFNSIFYFTQIIPSNVIGML